MGIKAMYAKGPECQSPMPIRRRNRCRWVEVRMGEGVLIVGSHRGLVICGRYSNRGGPLLLLPQLGFNGEA